MRKQLSRVKVTLLAIVSPLMMLALSPSAAASTAYGTLNNFDCVNDTGDETHGFEIELDDIHSTDISYTYDYNHYGIPKITEDSTDPAHPKVFVRYAAARKPDGTWTAFTAIPSGPITPTNGHQFTNPSVNFGGEHFGVGYNRAPTAVKYNWLIDDGFGNLVKGPPVYVATPTFTYFPPAPQQAAQVQAVIVPPPPPAPPVLQFGEATWVWDIKTTTHNPNKPELKDLIDPDPDDPNAQNWANGEQPEVETEWRLLQTEFANPDNPKGVVEGVPEDLPGGDEVITRRYEFYKYIGPSDAESGEAMADQVAPDGIHGLGTVTYNDHFDPITGEWVTVTVDLSTVEVVGEFFGAQMAGFDVAPVLGLVDHLSDGELNVAYADRTVVVAGGAAFLASVSGSLPDGMTLNELTGVFCGTPTAAGIFTFTVDAEDTSGAVASKTYTVTIPDGVPVPGTIATSASPGDGGSTAGDGVYNKGTPVTVVASHGPGYRFVNWTEGGIEVSASPVYPFTVNADRTLVANFAPTGTAATVTSAVSRKANVSGLGGVCDANLLPARKSESRQGGVTEVRIGFNVAPGSPNGFTVDQATCAAPAFVPYAGASVLSGSVAGNTLIVTAAPGLENARTYRINLGPEITSIAGQSVQVRVLTGDATDDGVVNAADRSAVVGAWTGVQHFSCSTDITNDGNTNAADRSAVVGAWTGPQNCAP